MIPICFSYFQGPFLWFKNKSGIAKVNSKRNGTNSKQRKNIILSNTAADLVHSTTHCHRKNILKEETNIYQTTLVKYFLSCFIVLINNIFRTNTRTDVQMC